MRRLLALSLVAFSVATGGAAGLAAPAALAAGTGTTPATGVGTTPGVITGTTPAVSTVPAVPPPSLSLSNGGQNVTPAQTQPTPVVVPPATSTSTSSGGLSGLDAVLIAVIALLVLAGIAFYVWRDARGAVSSIGHHASDDSMFARQHAGSKKPQKSRKPKPAERKRRKRGRAR
jgi:hypothetical protein